MTEDLEARRKHRSKIEAADETKREADERVIAARKRIAVADGKFKAYAKGTK